MEEAGLGDELGVAEALPGGEGKVDLGGVAFAAVFLIPVGEGLADLVGEGFELLFLAFLGLGIASGGGLLAGDEVGEGVDEWPELGGAGGEGGGFLVFPRGFVLSGVDEMICRIEARRDKSPNQFGTVGARFHGGTEGGLSR